MATYAFKSTIKRTTALPQSSESGDDSSYSGRKSVPRRHRSLSRFSHRMPDPDAEVTPRRKGKFVNTVRGSEFPEISLDDLAIEFFDSFSAESGVSGGERGRSGSRKSAGNEGDVTNSQRRGRSVSRGGPGGVRRLDADTESSRRRRSLSKQPSAREIIGNSGHLLRADPESKNSSRRRSVSRQLSAREHIGSSRGLAGIDPESKNSSRRRSVSRQPRGRSNADTSGGEIRDYSGSTNSRSRRSLSVVRCRIDNSESDLDQAKYSTNSRDVKSFTSGKSNGSYKPAASNHRQGLRRSSSQNQMKFHDGYSSQSSAVTDDEGKESSSSKHGTERIIRTVYAQNKATPKQRESLENSDYGSQRKSHDAHHAISTVAKLQKSEERKRDLLAEIMLEQQRGRELSNNLKELLTDNSSEAHEKPSRMRKRSKERSKMSMCLTDEAEQFIDEFISNIEDTDFSSFEDERSETSSSYGLIKTQNSQSTTVQKDFPVELDGMKFPWLQWETSETSDDTSTVACLNKSPNTPYTKSSVWESHQTQGVSSVRGMSICSISSKSSWSPSGSAMKPVSSIDSQQQIALGGPRRLKVDVSEYLKRPNNTDFVNESWKLRHRISSGDLVLSSRSFI